MPAEPQHTSANEAVDLRWIAAWVRRRGGWILSATIGAAVVGLILGFVLPDQYGSSAYLLMMDPVVEAELDDRISAEPVLPDQTGLGQLAETPAMLEPIYQAALDEAWIDADTTFAKFAGKLWATETATSQLQLTVRNRDPQVAAILCNQWARHVSDRFNDLFGVGAAELKRATMALDQKQAAWNEAAEALVEALASSRKSALEVQVEQAGQSVQAYLAKIRSIDLLCSDIEAYQQRLAKGYGEGDRRAADLGDVLSLLGLKQAATRAVSGLELQIAATGEFGGMGGVGGGDHLREQAGRLIGSLTEERERLKEQIAGLEERLIRLRSELESAKYEVSRLTTKRDLARRAYEAMASHVEDIRLSSSGEGNAVKIAARAVPLEEPISPQPLKLMVLAALAALILSTLALLLWDRYLALRDTA